MVIKLSKQDWKNIESNLQLSIKNGKKETFHYPVAESICSDGFHFEIYLYAKLKEKKDDR